MSECFGAAIPLLAVMQGGECKRLIPGGHQTRPLPKKTQAWQRDRPRPGVRLQSSMVTCRSIRSPD